MLLTPSMGGSNEGTRGRRRIVQDPLQAARSFHDERRTDYEEYLQSSKPLRPRRKPGAQNDIICSSMDMPNNSKNNESEIFLANKQREYKQMLMRTGNLGEAKARRMAAETTEHTKSVPSTFLTGIPISTSGSAAIEAKRQVMKSEQQAELSRYLAEDERRNPRLRRRRASIDTSEEVCTKIGAAALSKHAITDKETPILGTDRRHEQAEIQRLSRREEASAELRNVLATKRLESERRLTKDQYQDTVQTQEKTRSGALPIWLGGQTIDEDKTREARNQYKKDLTDQRNAISVERNLQQEARRIQDMKSPSDGYFPFGQPNSKNNDHRRLNMRKEFYDSSNDSNSRRQAVTSEESPSKICLKASVQYQQQQLHNIERRIQQEVGPISYNPLSVTHQSPYGRRVHQ